MAVPADDDDRRRHRARGQGFRHGRRRRRPAGHRHRRRLGAVVTATDVRPATKEQVESLGAKFVAVEDEEFKQAETAGGYAKEMSQGISGQAGGADRDPYRQAGHRHHHRPHSRPSCAKTGLGRQVASMRPGSVVVDMAAERGGNCELTKAGEIVVSAQGVKIIGSLNLAGRSRRHRVGALREKPARLRRNHDRQGRASPLSSTEDDEIDQGHAAHQGRRGRSPEFPAG